MHDSFDISTIIFAVLAIFVLIKLKSVLGTRTGEERPPYDPFKRRMDEASDQGGASQGNVIRLPGAAPADPNRSTATPEARWGKLADPAAFAGLDAIAAADAAFDGAAFQNGARSAYEFIVTAFARGDRDTLRGLLSPDVFESFASAISAREAQGETAETTFVSIDGATIADAHLRDGTAQVTLRFASKLISVTRDRAGAVVDGGTDKIMDVVDVWTFARPVKAKDPNWRLVATEAAH